MSRDIAGVCGDFTAFLWGSVDDLFSAILDHPFNREMAAGTLPQEIFRQYLEQDRLYLKEDNRALSLTAGRAILPDESAFFRELAGEGLALEEALHKELGDRFKMTPTPRKSRACREYGDYLVQTALKSSYEESVAALLPCYWIYQNAGKATALGAAEGNPYQSWLDTYGGDQFSHYSKAYVLLVEKVGLRSEKPVREKMIIAFRRSVEYELAFLPEF